MDMMQTTNKAILCGMPLAEPVFSHISRQERFFSFPLEVARLSGNVDRLNVILREELLRDFSPSRAGLLRIEGELRSFNNRSGEGSRLVITVFAQELQTPETAVWINEVELIGSLCKPPNHRITPMGRETHRMLLEMEGVPFLADGRVDMDACFWSGPLTGAPSAPGTSPDPQA